MVDLDAITFVLHIKEIFHAAHFPLRRGSSDAMHCAASSVSRSRPVTRAACACFRLYASWPLHSCAVSNEPIWLHLASGASKSGFFRLASKGGDIRYQPTSASAAACRRLMFY